jgi:hypothetical protein
MACGAVRREILNGAFFNAAADIVHDSRLRTWLDDNADVRKARVEKPGHCISNLQRLWKSVARNRVVGRPKASARACEISFKIEDASVVDVGVWMLRSPCAAGGIVLEVFQHVFVDELLEIEAKAIAGRANDDVCANAG